jgi:cytochrome c peroxidase
VSLGTDFHTRNAPPLVNSSFYKWTNWGGRFATQWELPIPVTENAVTMNGNRLAVVHRIFSMYRTEYEAVFGTLPDAIADTARFPAAGKPKPAPTPTNPTPPDGAWEGMTADDRTVVNRVMANYGKALAAYVRLLVSRNAPLDRFVAGEASALGQAERRGAELFIGKGACSNCHTGPHLSDDRFHRLNVPQVGANVPPTDDGRFRDAVALLGSAFNPNGAFSDDKTTTLLTGLTNPMPEETRAAFRTPGLRGVALTAPYMHSGQFPTLEAVVDFYAAAGERDGAVPSDLPAISLDTDEKADLVAFLKSLTGEDVPASLLVDTSKP